MRTSQFLLATVKETPADAETVSHQLMLRAGLIRKLASGLYTWLPMGLRVLHKVTKVVRDEMNKSGAMEVSMPVVQPSELWLESGRWDAMGPELLRIKDRHDRDFCLGPTHEEVITDLVRGEYASYKQLPANLYQIQTKFRDERRPRFGVMRAREFIMKDAYSFHISDACLEETYQRMFDTYCAIFTRLGLDFRPVLADTGNIGGSTSHEFHVLAESGEDEIVFSSGSDYAANRELAIGTLPDAQAATELLPTETIATGDAHSIDALCTLLGIQASTTLKTLVVHAATDEGERSDDLVALVLRGDQELNETKVEKIKGIAAPLEFASEEAVRTAFSCAPGCLGPLDTPELSVRVIADTSAAQAQNFVCGANKEGQHLKNANWERDCKYTETADIRKVNEGDLSPDGNGTLAIKRGIEVGHIFQLGKKYSEAMNASVLDENGKSVLMTMGCYGIGVTRIVAACIEQNNDDRGIIWPDNIAPFHLIIIVLDAQKSEQVVEFSEELYEQANAEGIETLLDDRDKKTSPGVKFAESELLGIPHRLVISPRGLADGVVEYTARRDGEKQLINKDAILDFLRDAVQFDARA